MYSWPSPPIRKRRAYRTLPDVRTPRIWKYLILASLGFLIGTIIEKPILTIWTMLTPAK